MNEHPRQTIFRLPLTRYGAMIVKITNGVHCCPSTLWRRTMEFWLRCQGLINVHQNHQPKVSTNFQHIWSHH
jgi:hypothetical protein